VVVAEHAGHQRAAEQEQHDQVERRHHAGGAPADQPHGE
jgi:hypothetical protein